MAHDESKTNNHGGGSPETADTSSASSTMPSRCCCASRRSAACGEIAMLLAAFSRCTSYPPHTDFVLPATVNARRESSALVVPGRTRQPNQIKALLIGVAAPGQRFIEQGVRAALPACAGARGGRRLLGPPSRRPPALSLSCTPCVSGAPAGSPHLSPTPRGPPAPQG